MGAVLGDMTPSTGKWRPSVTVIEAFAQEAPQHNRRTKMPDHQLAVTAVVIIALTSRRNPSRGASTRRPRIAAA